MSTVIGTVSTSAASTVLGTLSPGGVRISFSFNGTNQYAMHAAWDTLGDSTAYPPTFSFSTDNPDGFVVDPTLPITEFGRVGTDYHVGSLSNLIYVDTSPLNGTNAANLVTFPSIRIPNYTISVEMAFTAGDQSILGPSILTSVSGVLTGGSLVNAIRVDGSVYSSAPLVDGQHYTIEVDVDGTAVLGTLGDGTSSFGNLTLSPT